MIDWNRTTTTTTNNIWKQTYPINEFKFFIIIIGFCFERKKKEEKILLTKWEIDIFGNCLCVCVFFCIDHLLMRIVIYKWFLFCFFLLIRNLNRASIFTKQQAKKSIIQSLIDWLKFLVCNKTNEREKKMKRKYHILLLL
mgnify:CR=1 FL=1